MARILITGGSGVLGSKLVPLLTANGHTVRILSRATSRLAPDSPLEWAQAQLATGEGLAAAVSDVDVVIHAASSPFKDSYQVDVTGTGHLLAAAARADVKHLLYISIVGIDRIPYSYYRHKLAAEELIAAGDVPYTILRAAQFHELLDRVAQGMVRLPVWLLPLDFQAQPVDAGEVAQRMAELVEAGPSGRVADIAGPEVLRVREIARSWQQARGMRRPLIHLPLPGKVAAGFRQGYNTTPGSRFGRLTWAQWLRREYGAEITADEYATVQE
jgi:uncharacterized protein YbjT (DUF2867 family)